MTILLPIRNIRSQFGSHFLVGPGKLRYSSGICARTVDSRWKYRLGISRKAVSAISIQKILDSSTYQSWSHQATNNSSFHSLSFSGYARVERAHTHTHSHTCTAQIRCLFRIQLDKRTSSAGIGNGILAFKRECARIYRYVYTHIQLRPYLQIHKYMRACTHTHEHACVRAHIYSFFPCISLSRSHIRTFVALNCYVVSRIYYWNNFQLPIFGDVDGNQRRYFLFIFFVVKMESS